jgi:hypothetical protein
VFVKNRQLFDKIKVPYVITPHYGEM